MGKQGETIVISWRLYVRVVT